MRHRDDRSPKGLAQAEAAGMAGVVRHPSCEAIMPKTFQLSLAPQPHWQAINPWTFNEQGAQVSRVNIDLGQTPHPEVERAVL